MYTSYNEPKTTCSDRGRYSGKAEIKFSVLSVEWLTRWLLEDTSGVD